MENYLLFLIVATLAILSPGPGVVLTVTNAIRYGLPEALKSILGVAVGTFIVAGISVTSLGIILATSSLAFSILKYIGAAYLIYLGIKLWRAPTAPMVIPANAPKKKEAQFIAGLALQLTNPKAVFFFLAIFPQFIHSASDVMAQCLLVASYSALILIIHLIYAYLATSVRGWLTSNKGGRLLNRIGGSTFICFGAGLASSSK